MQEPEYTNQLEFYPLDKFIEPLSHKIEEAALIFSITVLMVTLLALIGSHIKK